MEQKDHNEIATLNSPTQAFSFAEELFKLTRFAIKVCGFAVLGCVILGIGITSLFTLNYKDLTLAKPAHHYNTCLEMLIDQSQREGSNGNLEHMKSVCIELINTPKINN